MMFERKNGGHSPLLDVVDVSRGVTHQRVGVTDREPLPDQHLEKLQGDRRRILLRLVSVAIELEDRLPAVLEKAADIVEVLSALVPREAEVGEDTPAADLVEIPAEAAYNRAAGGVGRRGARSHVEPDVPVETGNGDDVGVIRLFDVEDRFGSITAMLKSGMKPAPYGIGTFPPSLP